MTQYIVNVAYKVDSKDLSDAVKSLERISKVAKESEKLINNIDNASKRSGKSLINLGNAAKMAGVGIAAIGGIAVAGLALIVKNTMDAEREMALLESVIKSTGGAAGYTADQVDELSTKLSRMSTISAGEINEAASRMLTYTDIVGEQFPRAMQNAVDWSTRYGVSVVQAAETIGKAIQKPSAAAGALAQQGFKFTKEFIEQLKELERTGRLAEAQALMFEEIESGVAGAASAMRNTFGGAIKALQNSFNDLMTGKAGSLDGMTESINNLTDTLNDPKVQEGLVKLANGMIKIADATIKVLAEVPAFADWVRWLVTGNADLKNYHQTLEEYTKLAPEVERMTAEYTKMGWSIEKALDYDEEFRNMTARVEELSFAMRGITFDNFNVPVSESSLKPKAPTKPTSPTLPTIQPKGNNDVLKEQNALMREYDSIIKSITPSLDTYTQAFLDMNNLYATGKLGLDAYHEGLKKIAGAQAAENAAKVTAELERQKEVTEQQTLTVSQMVQDAALRLSYEQQVGSLIADGIVPNTRLWNEQMILLNEQYRITELITQGFTEEQAKQIAAQEKLIALQQEANDKAIEQGTLLQDAMTNIGNSLGNAFSKMMDGQKVNFKEMIRQMAIDLAKSQLIKMLSNLGGGMGGGWGTLFSGIAKGLGGASEGYVNASGPITPFAKGGVIGTPTKFYANGGIGLMGEAGPEAIVPLKRGRDGKLGVSGGNGGGGSNISIVNNVTVNGSDSPEESAELTVKTLDKMMDNKIKQIIQDQKRPGNMLG